jgi:hypothetical protein
MFGLTEEQISDFGMTFGIGAFMLFMLFIIGEIAWKRRPARPDDRAFLRPVLRHDRFHHQDDPGKILENVKMSQFDQCQRRQAGQRLFRRQMCQPHVLLADGTARRSASSCRRR